MADIYRKTSLEKISNPEQLDKALKITSPLSWLGLVGLTLIIVVAVIWSIFGSVPVTVTTQGIVVSHVGSNAVFAQEPGMVVSVDVELGDVIRVGDPVLTYRNTGNELKTLYSDQNGTVAGLTVNCGDTISSGLEIVRIAPSAKSSQIVVCYMPLAQAKNLKCGMDVNILLASQDSTTYGNMEGRIINVDAYATSIDGITSVVGVGNNMDMMFLQEGPVVAVACELKLDSNTTSEYYWTNKKGAEVAVTNGSLVTAKIVTQRIRPISKLFAKIDEP